MADGIFPYTNQVLAARWANCAPVRSVGCTLCRSLRPSCFSERNSSGKQLPEFGVLLKFDVLLEVSI